MTIKPTYNLMVLILATVGIVTIVLVVAFSGNGGGGGGGGGSHGGDDDAFLFELTASGLSPGGDRAQWETDAISEGHGICTDLINGESRDQIIASHMASVDPTNGSAKGIIEAVMNAAINIYCPKFK
jgi:Protein of unknown function (DUF732)